MDLKIAYGASSSVPAQLRFSYAGETGTCSGHARLFQTFMRMLLTVKGSVDYDADYGTSFLSSVRNGSVRTDSALLSQFNVAVVDILAYMNERLTGDEADSERLIGADLTSWDVSVDRLTLQVELYAADGTTSTSTTNVTFRGST